MSGHSWADSSHFTRIEQGNGLLAVSLRVFRCFIALRDQRATAQTVQLRACEAGKVQAAFGEGITLFGSVILEVALGLVFIYAWFSLACSALVEFLESLRAQRGKQLAIAIQGMLGAELKERFYQHGLIQSLSKAGRLPSYLPARNFSRVTLDLLGINAGQFRQNIDEIPGEIGRTLRSLAKDATSYEHLVLDVEHWFDSTMERCSGWFKRRARWTAFACGLVVAALLNVDSVEIASAFYSDAHLRLSVVSQAETDGQVPIGRRAADKGPSVMSIPIESGTLPLGWEHSRFAAQADWSEHAWRQPGFWFGPVLMKLIGLLVTALTASLGSAFWFDALRRMLALKSSFASNAEVMIKGSSSAIASLSSPTPAGGSASSPSNSGLPASTQLTAAALPGVAVSGLVASNLVESGGKDDELEIDRIIDVEGGPRSKS